MIEAGACVRGAPPALRGPCRQRLAPWCASPAYTIAHADTPAPFPRRRASFAMSFAAFILYVVLTFLRPVELFAPGLAAFRPMLLLWGFAFLLAVAQAVGTRRCAARPQHFLVMGLLVLAIACSALVRDGFGAAVGAVGQFSPSIMLMVLALLNVTTLRRLQITCGAISACILVLALAGIAAFHRGFMVDELVLMQSTYQEGEPVDLEFLGAPADDDSGMYMWRVRSVGFLNDPNDFGQAMVMVLPLLWGLVQRGQWLRNLVLFVAPAGVLLYTIFLTHSRGAIVGLGAMLLLGLRKAIGTVRTAMLMGVVLMAVVVSSFGGGRGFSSQEESASDRIDAWWAGLSLLKSYPVFGAGYGNFTDHHHLTAHNSFVLCFAELGTFGFFAWLGLIVIAYQGLAQSMQVGTGTSSHQAEARMAELLRAALVGFLACAWFLSRTYQPGMYLLLALCVSSWYCMRSALASEQPPRQFEMKPWARTTVLAMVASIAVTYVFVTLHSLGIG